MSHCSQTKSLMNKSIFEFLPKMNLKYNPQLLLIVCIALLPLMLYAYLWIPNSFKVTIFSYSITITEFLSYYVLGKLYVIFLLGLWFISEPRIWRYCLIPGMLLTFFQIASILWGPEMDFIILSLQTLLCGSLYFLLIFFISKRFSSHLQNSLVVVTSDIMVLIKTIQEHKAVFAVKEKTIDKLKAFSILSKKKSTIGHLRDLQSNRQFGSDLNSLSNKKDELTKASKIGIVIILLVLPVLFYSYKLVPNDFVELHLFGYSYNAGFPTFQTFVYFVCIKMFSFIYLITWFLTCQHIWRYAVLMNLIIVAVQLFSIVNPSFSKAIDEHELYYSFPFIVPILLLLFLLVKMYTYQMQIREADKELELEIIRSIEKYQASDINEKYAKPFQQLFKEKKYMRPKEYEERLIFLRNKLSMELVTLHNKAF